MLPNDVDEFVANLEAGWQRVACEVLLAETRGLAAPLTESIKWKNPFFEGRGAVVKWFVAREWINVYFYQGYRLDDPFRVFEPTVNSRMRTIKVSEQHPVDRTAFAKLLAAAVAIDANS